MNTKTTFGGLLAVVLMSGCVDATLTEDNTCDSKSVSFPVSQALSEVSNQLPAAAASQGLNVLCQQSPSQLAAYGLPTSYQVPPESTSTSFDFSSDLSKINSINGVSLGVQIKKLMLSNPNNEFAFVSSVEVDIANGDDGGSNSQKLATYSMATDGSGSQLNVDVVMSSDQILSYLEAGPVTLTITLNSNPITFSDVCTLVAMNGLNTNVDMCVSAEATYKKSL